MKGTAASPGPTVQQALEIFVWLRKGKALGPDFIPADLSAAAPYQLAGVLQPLMARAAHTGREPTAWGGGALVPLPKAKVDAKLTVAAFRPITVNDSLSKSRHV